MASRMRLRRDDGQVYLNRWGFEHDRIGGVFLHKMEAPDPGLDLHDHPWRFLSFILKGGYTEERRLVDDACLYAELAESIDATTVDLRKVPWPRGHVSRRRRFSFKWLYLNECHRITHLPKGVSWSIILHGPKRKDRPAGAKWGFYTSKGWVAGQDFRTESRDLWNEI
jgi:hypothetical protein